MIVGGLVIRNSVDINGGWTAIFLLNMLTFRYKLHIIHLLKLWLHEYFRYEAISILDKFRCLTCGRFVHKQKSSFCFFELVLDLDITDFEKSFDQAYSRLGNN